MTKIVRFSVSIEEDLFKEFDKYCRERHFATRSEAVRQILRETLTSRAWESSDGESAATLTIVYDHHKNNLSDALMDLQHEHTDLVVATTHVHLDHDNCLEVIILRGRASRIREVGARLQGLKGIHQGQLVIATAGELGKRDGRAEHNHPHSHPHAHSHSHSHSHEPRPSRAKKSP